MSSTITSPPMPAISLPGEIHTNTESLPLPAPTTLQESSQGAEGVDDHGGPQHLEQIPTTSHYNTTSSSIEGGAMPAHLPKTHCPSCGAALGGHAHRGDGGGIIGLEGGKVVDVEDARRRIAELEAQVRILSDKATAAADKLADYEDELHKLKRTHTTPTLTTTLPPPSPTTTRPSSSPAAHVPLTPQTTTTPTQRISAFLSVATRRGGGTTPPSPPLDPPPKPTSPPPKELEKLLSTEKTLRQQAEGRLHQVTSELEELSASLFQQANEMVATERKARSKLEERVAVLEKRDREKRERLVRLEEAVDRINRVKLVLNGEEVGPEGLVVRET